MCVLIFSHRNDIDGMGSVVLAKLAFQKVSYELCESADLETKFQFYVANKTIYNYDYIFITDLVVTLDFVEKINRDSKLKTKTFIFDHHKATLIDVSEPYDFLTIKLQDEKGLVCGTSLFYEFLVAKKLLMPKARIIEEFKELTRLYDTWEWKTIYHEERARDLTLLFDSLENETYINLMVEKLQKEKSFFFSELELELIKNRKKVIKEKINYYLKHLYYKKIKGYKTIVAFINYEFRNDLADYLRDEKYNADFVILISLDNNTISYRTISEEVSANDLAKLFGGKGHVKAAGSPITSKQMEAIINLLFRK